MFEYGTPNIEAFRLYFLNLKLQHTVGVFIDGINRYVLSQVYIEAVWAG